MPVLDTPMLKGFGSFQSLSMGALGSSALISCAVVVAQSTADQLIADQPETQETRSLLSASSIGSESNTDTNASRSRYGVLESQTSSDESIIGMVQSIFSKTRKARQKGSVGKQGSLGRRLQDSTCPLELLNSVQGDIDGYLTLTEYHNFFSNRYYRRCDLSDVELYTSFGIEISVAQTETFNSLSCSICLGEVQTPISSLPECCRAENAKISLDNPTAANFARICEEARATAIEECGYVAVIETTVPLPPVQPRPSPPVQVPISPSPPAPVPAQPNGSANQQCLIDLIDADSQVSDGLLDQTEFFAFLESHLGADCTSNVAQENLIGVFRQLACAWCLSASGASLDCCVGSAARVSISEASNTGGQTSNSVWLGRICSTVANEIGAICGIQSPTTPPLAQPFPTPVSSPLPPIVPPISFAPIKTPIFPTPAQVPSAAPMVAPLATSPLPGTSQIPTPDPTIRPPPGDPIGASTSSPTKREEPTSSLPIQYATFNPSDNFGTEEPMKTTSQPVGSPPRNEPNGNSSARAMDGFLTALTLIFLSRMW